MKFLSRLNPIPGIRDFKQEFLRPNPYRGRIMLAAAAVTFAIFSVIMREGSVGLPHPPQVTYISTFAPDRTDEEIISSNIENQRRKEQLAAEQAERNAKVQEIYRNLGRMSGMDVEKIEREAQIQREAEEKAAAEELARLTGRERDNGSASGQEAGPEPSDTRE